MVINDKQNLFIKIVSSYKRVYAIFEKSESLESINSLIAFAMSKMLLKIFPDKKWSICFKWKSVGDKSGENGGCYRIS